MSEIGGAILGGVGDGGAVCRGCMSSGSLTALSDHLKDMFTDCTGLKVAEDDGLPSHICLDCESDVYYCYRFINCCKRTDDNLRKFLTANSQNVPGSIYVAIKEEDDFHSSADEKCADSIETDEIKLESNNSEYIDNFKNDTKLRDRLRNLKKKRKKICESKERVIPKRAKYYTCPFCHKSISDKSVFREHLSKDHDENKKFVCTICSKRFSHSQYLNQHVLIHTREKPYICNICPKAYRQRSQLKSHEKVHSGEKPFKCDVCDMSFYVKHALVSHSKQHEEMNHHLCDLCGLDFTQKGNLKVHMRVHTGEKPYACTKCSFRCSVQSGLRRHERLHSNTRPHACTICHKTFTNSGSLIRHNRIHSGELPYKCSYCSKAFIDSWKRKTHLIKFHNISISDIPRLTAGRKRLYVKNNSKEELLVKIEKA